MTGIVLPGFLDAQARGAAPRKAAAGYSADPASATLLATIRSLAPRCMVRTEIGA